jgi:hypothetical protein
VFVRLSALAVLAAAVFVAAPAAGAADPAVVSVYPVARPKGLLVTSGGWAYCLQLRALARRSGYTLLCGRYFRDGYTGYGLRSRRRLDWGQPAYLASLATKVAEMHGKVGGELVFAGVSYSGFGVATLASHHPELRPDRLIVIDSFLDLPARRAAARSARGTAADIDAATGGSTAALQTQSVSVRGLAELVRGGTKLTVVWSVSSSEQREFNGATCDRNANAGVLMALAAELRRPVTAWVTRSRHGHDLWDSGRRIVAGDPPGREVVFTPGGAIPAEATCR